MKEINKKQNDKKTLNYNELYEKAKEEIEILSEKSSNDETKSMVSDRKIFTENDDNNSIIVPDFLKKLSDEQLVQISNGILDCSIDVIVNTEDGEEKAYYKEYLQSNIEQIDTRINNISSLIEQYYDKSLQTLKSLKIITTYKIYDIINDLECELNHLIEMKKILLKKYYYLLPHTKEDMRDNYCSVDYAKDNISSLGYIIK